MSRAHRIGVGLAALVLSAAVRATAGSDVVVLRGGARIELASPMVRKGDVVLLTRSDGTVFSVPASEIDVDATAALRAAPPSATPAPTTAPPQGAAAATRSARTGEKARTKITDEDLRRGRTVSAPAASAAETAPPPARAGTPARGSTGAADATVPGGDPCQAMMSIAIQAKELRDRSGPQAEQKNLQERLNEASLGCARSKCDRGNAEACELASILLSDRGLEAESRLYVEKACRAGRKMSCDALHLVAPALKQIDDIRAREEGRCTAGGPGTARSCTFVGVLYFKDGLFPQAGEFFRKGCDGGDGKGCANLAFLAHQQGRDAEAIPLMEKACRSGFTSACHRNIASVDQPW